MNRILTRPGDPLLTRVRSHRIVALRGGTILSGPSHSFEPDVTRLLEAWKNGDMSAADRLLPLVYDELHRAAARAMRSEGPGHTLQPTALVNEVYLRFAGGGYADWQSRAHFYGAAAQAMRRILVDHARSRDSAKRGGGERAITLDEERDAQVESSTFDVIDLNDALEKLREMDADQARIVELRYFTGLTIDETAEALNISPATVKRDWATARAWLRRELAP
jgi:RNA polymerase sigma factor (TIGR02999 family)